MNLVSGSSQRHARRHSYIPTVSSAVAESASPPAYQAGRRPRSGRRHSQQPLPAYAQAVALDLKRSGDDSRHGSSSQQVYEFSLLKGGGMDTRAWATLKVAGRAPSSSSSTSQKVPKFFGGDSITGTFELDLERPQTINSITLSLRGRFITGFLEEGTFTFLNQVVTIWDKNAGDPRMPHPSPLDFDGSKKTKYNAKLEGTYSWPFSLHFPTEIIMSSRNGFQQRVAQTPQSFLERGVSANIQYQLVVHITHGLFKANSKLQANVQYAPSFSPAPASFLRQQAYIQGGFLLPPSEDPTGWHALPENRFQHRVGNVSYDLQLSLSVAEPLSYTRGTVIPCFLTITNNSMSHVDLSALLLSPTSPLFEVQLQRRITHLQDASQTVGSIASGTGTKAAATRSCEKSFDKATWWKPASLDSAQSPGECHLEGEIHLSSELSPSCDVGFFALEYSILLIPCADSQTSDSATLSSYTSSPSLIGRSPSSQSQTNSPYLSKNIPPVLNCPIKITTFHVHGPQPTPFTTRAKQRDGAGRSTSALEKRASRSNVRWDEMFGSSMEASTPSGLNL